MTFLEILAGVVAVIVLVAVLLGLLIKVRRGGMRY